MQPSSFIYFHDRGYTGLFMTERKHAVKGRRLLFALLLLLLSASSSFADMKADYGVDLRLRYEYWKGVFDMGTLKLEDENFGRLKTSFWGRLDINEHSGAYLRISSEPRYYISSSSPDNESFEQDEIFFESLYVDVKNAAGLPVDLRIGRQDLQYGDGFLIYDGAPVTSDRTKYFNAAKATWKISRNTSIDFVYIYNTMTDRLLPVIHPSKTGRFYKDNKRILTSSDEEAFVLYGRRRIGESFTIEPYYIYKRENKIDLNNPELELNTIGGRAVCNSYPWQLKGEYARQFGQYKGGRKRKGTGGNVFVGRSLGGVMWKPGIEAGYVYMSGDDPGSKANESWDPLFSRYRWISGLYKYAFSRETGIGSYWTNLALYRISVLLNFTPATKLSLAYNYLRANEQTKITGPFAAIFSNKGKERGHLQQVLLSHEFNKGIRSLLIFEYFKPGNFYSKSAGDASYLALMVQIGL